VQNKSVNVRQGKVASSITTPQLHKTSSARRVAASLQAQLVSGYYRPDLLTAAKARACALLAAQKPKNVQAKKMRANKLAKLAKARAN